MKKQTAANNDFLKQVKKIWNEKVFQQAAKILNNEGIDAARAYVQQFTTKPLNY